MKNEMFNYDPYEALIRLDNRCEYLEHQTASAFALLEKQHNEMIRLHKQVVDLQTVVLHHSQIVKESTNG